MQWFSDNLALAYPIDGFQPASRLAQLLAEVGYLQVAFLEAGLLGRGAIARGDFFADATFIYGPALERAVALENSRAVYSRCVIDEATYRTATDALMIGDTGGTGSTWRKQLATDQDGVVFIDYLGVAHEDPAGYGIDIDSLLAKHKRLIEKNLCRYDGVRAVEDKYRWLAGYHNHTVDALAADDNALASHRLTVSRTTGRFTAFGGSSELRKQPT